MNISAQEAKIKTATVEIKALTVSGKQVTLALFRQFKDSDIIHSQTLELLGQPWGTVNYHPDSYCHDDNRDDHLHVVWQAGDELRRCLVKKSYPWRPWDRADLEQVQRTIAKALGCPLDAHAVFRSAEYLAEEARMRAAPEKYARIYEEFQRLDQLFIAI